MAEDVPSGAPFWAPNNRFDLYVNDPDWRKSIADVQGQLRCEPWQAWVVQLLLCQANVFTRAMILDQAMQEDRHRQPWETDDDEDDDE